MGDRVIVITVWGISKHLMTAKVHVSLLKLEPQWKRYVTFKRILITRLIVRICVKSVVRSRCILHRLMSRFVVIRLTKQFIVARVIRIVRLLIWYTVRITRISWMRLMLIILRIRHMKFIEIVVDRDIWDFGCRCLKCEGLAMVKTAHRVFHGGGIESWWWSRIVSRRHWSTLIVG